MKVAQTYYFANGNVAVCGPDGKQIPELQGHWGDVWRKVWDAADENTVFHGWPSTHGDSRLKRNVPEELWPAYFAICGARSKGLLLAVCDRVEQAFPDGGPIYGEAKMRAGTDTLKSLCDFHDEAVALGMSGSEIMTEWAQLAKLSIEGAEKLAHEGDVQ